MFGNNVLRMMFVISLVWALVIGESYLLFFVIRPVGPNIHENLLSEMLKIPSTIALAVLWVLVLFGLETLLFNRKRANGPPSE